MLVPFEQALINDVLLMLSQRNYFLGDKSPFNFMEECIV